MENIMTSRTLDSRNRLGRTGLSLALGLVLLANLGDRAMSASAANGGVDPLEILNTAVKNNILFIVDTSSSMAGTPQDQSRIVGGDDPASRFYQTKRAVRDVITQNAGKANFGEDFDGYADLWFARFRQHVTDYSWEQWLKDVGKKSK